VSEWRLSAHEIESYHHDGLVAPKLRLSDDVHAQMRAAVDKLLRDNEKIAPESLVCPHIPYGDRHNEAAAAQWFKFATQPQILDLVEQLIGPDIILWGSQVFCKPAHTGRAIPWHQDGQYWPIRPIATCSVWMAIDDARPENGCMRYIPGSHRKKSIYEHRTDNRRDRVLNDEVVDSAFDESSARDDVLRAGEFSLHDVYLIHGSNANTSEKRRAAYVVRYMPATSLFDRAHVRGRQSQSGVAFSLAARPIWLVRGSDRAGNDFETGHGATYQLTPRASDDV
jgi:hypothetical protein